MVKTLNQPLSAQEIAAICHGIHRGKGFFASEVSTDSRKLSSGALFVALHGTSFNGEDFLPQAKAKGAVAAIVEKAQDIDLAQIVVDDTLAALTALAAERRGRSQAQFFAVTGSNGKTSTKEILQRLLQTTGETLATHGNLNNEIGVPLTLLRLQDKHRYAVIEAGANHPGEIARLTTLIRPDVALITNVGAAHLAGFGSLAGVINAKSELYNHSNGAIVINRDLPISEHWCQQYKHRQINTFALHHEADITADAVAADGRSFVLCIRGKKYPVAWQMRGRHHVENALAACAAADFAGVSGEQMQQVLNGLCLQQGRLTAYRVGIHTVYDDTYNANPASFKAAIDVLANSRNTLLIAGAMAELGAEEVALHQAVAAYARQSGLQAFWAVGEGAAKAYLQGFAGARHFSDIETAGKALQERLQTDTAQTILVKGSRSAKMERIFIPAGINDQINI